MTLLESLRLEKITTNDGFVAIWITNNARKGFISSKKGVVAPSKNFVMLFHSVIKNVFGSAKKFAPNLLGKF